MLLRKFMKYLLFSIVFLYGCYSQRVANNQLEKAKIKYPELVADKSSKWFPVLPIQITTDSTGYKLYLDKLDSLNRSVLIQYDTIRYDTTRYNYSKEIVYKYNTLLKQIPAIRDTIRILDKAKQEALELKATDTEKKLMESYKLMNKISIVALILLLILFTISILKR